MWDAGLLCKCRSEYNYYYSPPLLYSERALYGVGSYYQSSANLSSFDSNVYWLNNFDNIYQSYGKTERVHINYMYMCLLP